VQENMLTECVLNGKGNKSKDRNIQYSMQGLCFVTTGCYRARGPKNGTMINDMNCLQYYL